jgi:ABC-type antimicrobial peptide transport system permease subunit
LQSVGFDGFKEIRPMDTLLNDLRIALRSFVKNPGFAVLAVLTLALGIGANTGIFSLVNAVLLRSLPYSEPESLVVLWGNVQRQVVERRGASYPDFLDWRAQNRVFSGMAAYWDTTVTLTDGGEPERVSGEAVSASYFTLLGVHAIRGRVFVEQDEPIGSTPVVLISDGLWSRRFGRRPEIIGSTIRFGQRSATVVGVLPPGFKGLTDMADFWVTPAMDAERATLDGRGRRWFSALARLKPGVTRTEAQADMDRISRNLERAYFATNEKRGVEVSPLTTELFGDIKPALMVVLAAVGLVLLIACANVAGLLLARAEVRAKEMAIRAALGASRRRLYRQLATESVVLALAAGLLGALAANWATGALIATSPVTFPGFVQVRIDRGVLLFTLAVSTIVGIALGLAPAWRLPADGVHDALKETAGRGSIGAARHLFRQGIVTGEVALAVMLLVGAGLLIRTVLALNAVDPGFNPERLLMFRVSLPALPPPPTSAVAAGSGTAAAAGAALEETGPSGPTMASLAILDRVRTVAGVERANTTSDRPLAGESSAASYSAEGQPPVTAENRPRAYLHRVTPGFFRTMGIRLVAGRDFASADMRDGTNVVIVSEEIIDRFWPGENPIGKRIKAGRAESKAPWFTTIGVVGQTQYRRLPRDLEADPDLFIPLPPRTRDFALVVKTQREPEALIDTLRREIRAVEPGATVYDISTLEERVRLQTARSRFVGWLMGAFAVLALLLAAVGVYGVLAQVVARRTPEIGVRMALGAGRAEILRMVMASGFRLVALGLLLGSAGALVLSRLIRAQLFGVRGTDPLTFLTVAALLTTVALLATWLPARRATQVDPLVALRQE